MGGTAQRFGGETPERKAERIAQQNALVVLVLLGIVAVPLLLALVMSPNSPQTHWTPVGDVEAWAANVTASFKAQGLAGTTVEVGGDGPSLYLGLHTRALISRSEADQLANQLGELFYKRFPQHPLKITVYAYQEPGQRQMGHALFRRPGGQ